MQFIHFPKQVIDKLQNTITTLLNTSNNVQFDLKIERYQLPKEYGGMELKSLHDLQSEAFISSFLNQGINFPAMYPKSLILNRYSNYKKNPQNDGNKENNSIQEIENLLKDRDLKTDGWQDNMEKREFQYKLTNKIYYEDMTYEYISKVILEDQFIIAATDGSFTETIVGNKVGSAICYGKNTEKWRTSLSDNNLGAELESICRLVAEAPINKNLLIATDSLNSIILIKKKSIWKHKEKYTNNVYHIVSNIKHIIEERKSVGIKTKFVHINSHQNESTQDKKENN
jgi:hypothetical protein